MIWDVRNKAGQGRQINYAQLALEARQWSEQVSLAEVDTRYGVLFPAVAEHDGEVIAAYSGITMRRSEDGGLTWSDPASPFRLTGINGDVSFVTDSSGTLHLFWGQRLSGSPDIHGMWHSTWQGGNNRWSEPEPIVSGPSVSDLQGDKSFDPYDARAVVVLGNTLLVAWRSDPGLKGNGVWYAYRQIDAPKLAIVPMPTKVAQVVPQQAIVVSMSKPEPTLAVVIERSETAPEKQLTASIIRPAR